MSLFVQTSTYCLLSHKIYIKFKQNIEKLIIVTVLHIYMNSLLSLQLLVVLPNGARLVSLHLIKPTPIDILVQRSRRHASHLPLMNALG